MSQFCQCSQPWIVGYQHTTSRPCFPTPEHNDAQLKDRRDRVLALCDEVDGQERRHHVLPTLWIRKALTGADSGE